MCTGTKMLNLTQENKKIVNKRGRPSRHKSERIRTIAWYYFLQGDTSPTDMAQWLPFNDIDQATIYRYRSGQISPRSDVLNADDEAFQAASNVYETGPFNVPLWDAMWGSLVPADFKLADRVMPGGEWPQSLVNELFFDDPILARIIGFRQSVVRSESITSDLKVFAAAVRVCRACGTLGHGNPLALRVLIEGSMALPGARGLLARLGLVKPMQEWIASQFKRTAAEQTDPAYWAPWMDGDELFSALCHLAELRRLQVRHGLSSKSDTDFGRALITDPVQGESQH